MKNLDIKFERYKGSISFLPAIIANKSYNHLEIIFALFNFGLCVDINTEDFAEDFAEKFAKLNDKISKIGVIVTIVVMVCLAIFQLIR